MMKYTKLSDLLRKIAILTAGHIDKLARIVYDVAKTIPSISVNAKDDYVALVPKKGDKKYYEIWAYHVEPVGDEPDAELTGNINGRVSDSFVDAMKKAGFKVDRGSKSIEYDYKNFNKEKFKEGIKIWMGL